MIQLRISVSSVTLGLSLWASLFAFFRGAPPCLSTISRFWIFVWRGLAVCLIQTNVLSAIEYDLPTPA